MAKVLRIAAMVVAVAAAIPTGGTSLLGSGLLSVGAAATVAGASTLASAIAVGMSFITALTAKKPSLIGGSTEWRSDPNAPIPIVFGETLVAGNITYRKNTNKSGGTKNKFQLINTVISGCGPIEAILATQIDKVNTTFSGDNAVGSLNDRVYQKTQLGACPEANALIPTGPWPSMPGWTASHKQSGLAASMNVFVFDGKGSNTFTQVPAMMWKVRGVKCYDPRFDSTYPGGVGSCRSNDQTTWVFSKNPYIQAITWAIGWRQGPNNIRVGGVGMPIASIDIASFVEAANIADLNNWYSGGRVTTADDKWNVMKALCQAGGGEPIRLGATLSCIVNTPRISIGTIRYEDLVGDVSVKTTQTRRDRINGIIPVYRSADHFYEVVPAGIVRNNDYLAQDGGIERTKEIEYKMVQCESGQNPTQVAQLAGYDIANSREAGPATIPLKIRWLGYRAGDCLTIDNDPAFRYLAGKTVVVMRRQIDPANGSVVLTVREETAAKHTWAMGLVGEPAPTTEENSRPVAEPPDIADWTVSTHVETIEGLPTGTIQIEGGVSDDTAWFVLVEYRETGSTEWLQSGWFPVSMTTHEIIGLAPDRTYEMAISYFSGERLIFSDLNFSYLSFDSDDIKFDNDTLTFDRVA